MGAGEGIIHCVQNAKNCAYFALTVVVFFEKIHYTWEWNLFFGRYPFLELCSRMNLHI